MNDDEEDCCIHVCIIKQYYIFAVCIQCHDRMDMERMPSLYSVVNDVILISFIEITCEKQTRLRENYINARVF